MGLGILLGTTTGVILTVVLFLLTALWVPLRIVKLLQVTITTKECFKGFLGPILRIFVLFGIPIVPVCSWIGGTILCATVGTLFLIGATTQKLFLQEYHKSIKIVLSNITLQPQTPLGDLSRRYHELLSDDLESHPSIYMVKGILTILPGLFMATLVVVPYSVAIFIITIYRLPINVYQTVKIAVRTVLLRWDLRLVVLVLLPIIHLLFPFLTLVGALIGCFFWTWGCTSADLFDGKHPRDVIHRLKTSLVDYHQVHQDFVNVHCLPYDHPTGIPDGWDGRTYGIAVERLLRFQRDLLICCFLAVLELPLCLLFTCVISILKYIPTCIHLWTKYATKCCCNQAMLACWPFHLLALLFLPVGVLGCHVILIVVTVLGAPFHIVQFYFDHIEDWLTQVWNLQLDLICCHDVFTGSLMDEYQFFRDLIQWREEERQRQLQEILATHAALVAARNQNSPSLWDQVQKQCIRTTSKLLQDGCITQDQVADMDPSAIQSIPSVAIWTVLIESCSSKNPVGPKEIRWEVDGTVCNRDYHFTDDQVARFLWPMVMDLKQFLSTTPTDAFSPDNVQVVTAMLCSNAEVNTPRVEQLLLRSSALDPAMQQCNNEIRAQITALVLALLRVGPYQGRMTHIFTHDYGTFPILDHGEDDEESRGQEFSVDTTQTGQRFNHGNQAESSSTNGSITETDEFRT